MQLTAELGEVKAVHGDLAGVASVRNAQVLRVKCDQVKCKLGSLLLALVVKNDV